MNRLEQFRDLKISKQVLSDYLLGVKADPCSVLITNEHVIALLKAYISKHINQSQLLEWVNTVWFSDWYDYAEDEADCIASVMSVLEELDESEKELSFDRAMEYIQFLKKNKSIEC